MPLHVESVAVHFDDLDAMGMVHNARYAVLLERALTAYWTPLGHSFENGRPTSPDVVHAVAEFTIRYLAPIRGTGRVDVHFWMEHLGETSFVYGYRFVSGETVHAEGRRTIVKLDPTTLRPAPWSADARAIGSALALEKVPQ
jgi:acyl-CoA thioester hydrolase